MSPQNVRKEINRKMRTSVSKSHVYGLLRRLWEMNWVHRYYDQSDQARHNIVAIDWGGILVQQKYDNIVVEKERDYMSRRLFPIFSEFIKRTIQDLHEDPDKDTNKWLPQPNDYCRFCRKSHEAEEFFNSLLDIATAEFMESKECLELLKENKFVEKEEHESK
jgi:DNA-binding MarR family transcriptional regulator